MNALQHFEGWVNQLVEGGLAGLLGAQIQPVDLAKRLADYMEDRPTVGAGRVYVPNLYRLYLAPGALAGFTTYVNALEAELAAFLTERARERHLHTVGRIKVTLLADTNLRAERLRIEGDLVDRDDSDWSLDGRTRPLAAAPAPPMPVALDLVVGHRRVPLVAAQSVAIGRALDNDVILDDRSVSRHHARLVPRVGYWLIEDLGSMQGSYVNKRRVASAPLRPGDQIRLGTVVATVEAREELTQP